MLHSTNVSNDVTTRCDPFFQGTDRKNFSISFWVKTNSCSSDFRVIAYSHDDSNTNNNYLFTPTWFSLATGNNSSKGSVSFPSLYDNQIHYVTAFVDYDHLKFGVHIDNKSYYGNLDSAWNMKSNTAFAFGADFDSWKYGYFKKNEQQAMDIASIKIYSKPLTLKEHRAVMRSEDLR